ncbi:anion permease [Nisaea acidiphila]|uniref:Anion permease n=1 Tax=Nisaea acidiphila TaxID=1862145 RepID=A0A9J7AXC9_9PROT|nr:anion permease [Nisaea acidiphila]UUX50900.1 anion permease [Nisaea acidiphila]
MQSFAPRHLILLPVLAIGAWLAFLPPEGMPPGAAPAGALVVLCIGLWATGAIAEHLVAMLLFFLAMVFAIAPPATVFSGFASGAFWLVFGGLIIGAAVDVTGLGKRLARAITARISGGYGAVIAGIVTVSVVLIFLMPSTLSRIVLLMPIILALADRLGYADGSKGRQGMVLAMILSSYLCSVGVLPSNVPNNVLVGAAETSHGVVIRYFDYLLLHFPVLGAVKAVMIALLLTWMFGEAAEPKADEVEETGPTWAGMTLSEKKMALYLAIALVLWATDAVHGISPAWISLGIGIVCLLPGAGLVSPDVYRQKISFNPLIYIAGILAVGALVAQSGLGTWVGAELIAAEGLEPGNPAEAFAVIAGLGTFLGMISTMPAVPAVLAPLASELSAASGFPLFQVMNLIVVGFSTVIMPYQVPPFVIGMQLGNVPLASGARACLALALLSFLVILPLDFIWWWMLGMFG